MFGDLAGARYDVPMQSLFGMAAEGRADTGNYRSRILSVTQVGDAATATVTEDGYWGTVSFVDSPHCAASTACEGSSTRPSPASAANRRRSFSSRSWPQGTTCPRRLPSSAKPGSRTIGNPRPSAAALKDRTDLRHFKAGEHPHIGIMPVILVKLIMIVSGSGVPRWRRWC
jgi:hypothetical protein